MNSALHSRGSLKHPGDYGRGVLITESHWAIATVSIFENAAHAVLSVLGAQLFIRHEN